MKKIHSAVALIALSLPGLVVSQTTVDIPLDQKTRTVGYEYHPDGRVKFERREPDGANGVKLVTELQLTGDVQKLISTGWDGKASVARTVTTDYGVDGRFPKSVTNAVFLQESREYDARFALPTLVVDANGAATRIEYDDFGRKVKEKRGYVSSTDTAFTDYSSWKYERCVDLAGACAAVLGVTPVMRVSAGVYSSADAKIAPSQRTYLDKLGREIRVEAELLVGGTVEWVRKDTAYNADGTIKKVSLPYRASQTAYYVEYEYDILGRKKTETAANGLQTQITRSGLKTTITVKAEDGDRTRTIENDLVGLPRKVTDARNHAMYFVHDGFGNRTHTIDAYGNQTVTEFDAYGRRTALTDPDVGAKLVFTPNAFGEISSETDGLGRKTTREFDLLGRTTKELEPDLTSTFVYDTAAEGYGKLHKAYTDNGYCRTHSYDALGRPSATLVGVGGTAPCTSPTTASFNSSVGYDAAGRVSTQLFPTGVKLKNTYNATLGHLVKIQNFTGDADGGTVYWQWQASDAFGHTTQFVAGNVQTLKAYEPDTGLLSSILSGSSKNASLADVQMSDYFYTKVGDLRLRSDKFDLPEMHEKAVHDALGRLTSYARYTADNGTEIAGSKVTMSYDAIGNLKTKSDVGTYYYNASGASAVRPHAVAEVRGSVNDSLSYQAGTGNLLSAVGRTFSYNAGGQIISAGTSSNCHKFVYQSEGMRVQQSVYRGSCLVAGALQSQTIYIHPDAANGLHFEREQRGTKTYYKHYLSANGDVFGMLVTEATGITSNTAGTLDVFHEDHLGSVVAVTSATGAVLERRSFDPWGRTRAPNGTPTDGELPGGLAAVTDRGFTLHEHLEGVGLLHMNGRAYDFTLGRFTSPDPFVPQPDDMQSYNRYAYVMNRPLISTDPTGFFDQDWGNGGGLWSTLARYFGVYGDGSSRSANVGITFSTLFGSGSNNAPNGTAASGQTQAGTSYGAGLDYSATAQFGAPPNGNISPEAFAEYRQIVNAAFDAPGTPDMLQMRQRFPAVYQEVWGSPPSASDAVMAHLLAKGHRASLNAGISVSHQVWIDAAAGQAVENGAAAQVGLRLARSLASTAPKAPVTSGVTAGCCCFAAGTPVATASGPVPIEQVQVGDLVYARSPKTGETQLKPVTQLIHTEGKPLFELSFRSQSGEVSGVEVTDNHPFWVKGKGWVKSAKLRRAMQVESLDNSILTVVSVRKLRKTQLTYNFTVADFHTYFAGGSQILVHNNNGCNKCSVGAKTGGGVEFRGLVQNRPLGDLTHRELQLAFRGTGYQLSDHAAMRLKDPRTKAIGFSTLNDIKNIFNKGQRADAGRGEISLGYRGLEAIIDPRTNVVITVRPAKARD